MSHTQLLLFTWSAAGEPFTFLSFIGLLRDLSMMSQDGSKELASSQTHCLETCHCILFMKISYLILQMRSAQVGLEGDKPVFCVLPCVPWCAPCQLELLKASLKCFIRDFSISIRLPYSEVSPLSFSLSKLICTSCHSQGSTGKQYFDLYTNIGVKRLNMMCFSVF